MACIVILHIRVNKIVSEFVHKSFHLNCRKSVVCLINLIVIRDRVDVPNTQMPRRKAML